jgi:hypothetical protein
MIEVTNIDGRTGQPEEYTAAVMDAFTGWKRIYVERDRMFRRGGILHDNAAKDDTYVLLYKNPNDIGRLDNLVEGDKIAIFDTGGPSGGSFEGVHDEAYIAPSGINPNYGSPPPGAPHQVRIDLVTTRGGSTPYTLSRSYTASPANATTFWPDFGNAGGKSAGVGVVNSNDGLIYDTATNQTNGPGSAFYDADMRDIQQPFDDAFVQVAGRVSGAGAVPFMSQEWFDVLANGAPLRLFHQIWFANKYPMANPQFNNARNYFHLIGASKKTTSGNLTSGYSFDDSDISFIFLDSIAAGCTTCSASDLILYGRETVDHELAHQFKVNGCNPTSGHDNNNAWCGNSGGPCVAPALGTQYCIMHNADDNSNAMRTSGNNRLDCDDLAAAGPACGIPACADGISVRTDTDPE